MNEKKKKKIEEKRYTIICLLYFICCLLYCVMYQYFITRDSDYFWIIESWYLSVKFCLTNPITSLRPGVQPMLT